MLARVCDLLDRKLFETSVAAEVTGIAADVHGFEETVAAVLGVLQRFVDYDLAAVVLADERVGVRHGRPADLQAHYGEFVAAAADALSAAAGREVSAVDLSVRVADPTDALGRDEDGRMATFLSMPLRGHGGRVIGVLALSSAVKNAFGETALATLRLVEGPAAFVIENARLAAQHGHSGARLVSWGELPRAGAARGSGSKCRPR